MDQEKRNVREAVQVMHVFSGIGAETSLLLESLAMGVGMFAIYDVIRVFRRVIAHGVVWISVEDLIYWVTVAGWFFLRIGKVNNGIVRFYVILGILLGALIYYNLFSRYFIRYVGALIRRIKNRLQKIWKAAKIKTDRLKKLRDKDEH